MVSSNLTTYDVPSTDIDLTNFSEKYVPRISFYKQYNIVICIYTFVTKTFSDTSDYTIIPVNTVPKEFRPKDTVFRNIVSYNGSIRQALVKINKNGGVTISMGANNTKMNVYGSFEYIVEE